jgi:hypothetical protein
LTLKSEPRSNNNIDCLTDMLHRETERDWDVELGDDVRGECEEKYGTVVDLKVEKESEVCLFLVLDIVPANPFLAG